MPCASCNKTPEDFESYSGWYLNESLEIGLCPDCYHDYQIGKTVRIKVNKKVIVMKCPINKFEECRTEFITQSDLDYHYLIYHGKGV